MPTNPPLSPLPGAVYVDQSTNIAWVWTGTYWLQAYGGSTNYSSQQTPTTSIIPGHYAEPSPDSWFPSVGATAPGYPSCGQIWIDNSVIPNYAQVWDCNTNTWIQLGGTAGGDTNSIVSAVAPTVRASGDALVSGDLWIEPGSGALSYWNGTAWGQISTPDTHSVFSTAVPATRAGGYTLVAGDLWTNPNDNSLNYWTGLAWIPVVAVDGDHQLSATVPVLRPDGNALLVADLWTNTTSNTLFYWSGTSWDRYNDSHSFEETAQPVTRPDGTPLQGGDQWFNPTADTLFVYDSTSSTWVLISKVDTHSFFSGVAPTVRTDGTALLDGDMWVGTAMNAYGYHELKVWHSTAWHDVGTQDTHAFVGSGAPALTVRPDGRVLLIGDIYVDSASKSSYYWTGTVWEVFGSDTHSFVDSGAPALTTRPNGTALVTGDQYIDNATEQGYYWDGVAWTLFGADTHSFVGPGAPTLTVRPNGTALQTGDQYVDSGTDQLYYYDTTWKLSSGDTHSFVDNGIPALVTRPGGSALVVGDQYINSASDIAYYWDGANWVVFGADTHSFTGTQPPGPAGLNLTVRPDGNALQTGDQFFDDTSNTLWIWTGTTWVYAQHDFHSFYGTAAPTITVRPDGEALVQGDQFYDSVGAELYVYTGAVWRSISGGGQVFSQNSAPALRPDGTALLKDDLWYDTSYTPAINNYYDGSAWQSSADLAVVAVLPAAGSFANQLLVNSTTNRMYRWDAAAGPAWVQVA